MDFEYWLFVYDVPIVPLPIPQGTDKQVINKVRLPQGTDKQVIILLD